MEEVAQVPLRLPTPTSSTPGSTTPRGGPTTSGAPAPTSDPTHRAAGRRTRHGSGGQYLTNIRRPGGLGKDPDRAQRRAAALTATDPDWNPGTLGWTVDWQRHYTYLTQLLAEGARPAAIVPGVTRHGDDIGRWLTTQRQNWDLLNEEQQRRLGELGVKKAVRVRKTAAKTATATGQRTGGTAFQKGLEALQQYKARGRPRHRPACPQRGVAGRDGGPADTRSRRYGLNAEQREHLGDGVSTGRLTVWRRCCPTQCVSGLWPALCTCSGRVSGKRGCAG
ncbi:Helicase associated domain protein [Streptomyces sp. NPDC048424]|uniref:Helicase associated domain protein n=1 Tax=Streptomyces sp. NPDC048424 TaxID=3155265 RepID=UPI0034227AD8